MVIRCFIEAAADFKVSGQASEFRRKVMKLRRQGGFALSAGAMCTGLLLHGVTWREDSLERVKLSSD